MLNLPVPWEVILITEDDIRRKKITNIYFPTDFLVYMAYATPGVNLWTHSIILPCPKAFPNTVVPASNDHLFCQMKVVL